MKTEQQRESDVLPSDSNSQGTTMWGSTLGGGEGCSSSPSPGQQQPLDDNVGFDLQGGAVMLRTAMSSAPSAKCASATMSVIRRPMASLSGPPPMAPTCRERGQRGVRGGSEGVTWG
jgi:hypothetical protein